MYINGQAQQQGISIHQDPMQHQYAVVKKTGSKRDIRDNLERENSAIFKVKHEIYFHRMFTCNPRLSPKVSDLIYVLSRRIDSSQPMTCVMPWD